MRCMQVCQEGGQPMHPITQHWSLKSATYKGRISQGVAADIYKCFDQIERTLLHRILKEAGMPAAILEPYRNFLENLEVYNTVAGGLRGTIHQTHEHTTGRPDVDDGGGVVDKSMDHTNAKSSSRSEGTCR